MSVRPGDNHAAKPRPSEERCIERMFLQLGDILAEIASDLHQEEGGLRQLNNASQAQPEVGGSPKKKALSIKTKEDVGNRQAVVKNR
jgi:hypothetical protein